MVPGVVAELEAATPRLTLTANYGERTSGGSKTAPAPVNLAALDAKHTIHTWLIDKAIQLGASFPRGIVDLTRHLTRNLDTITVNGWADAWAGELREHLATAQNVTTIKEPRVFAGTCATCSTGLYATKGEHDAQCRTCGTRYEVLKWRAFAATAKEYFIGTPAELSRALSSPEYGIEVTVNQICMWATRDKLQRANETTDEAGNPLKPTYRLKDVLDLNAKRKPLDGTAA
jgi:hypothetical protein